MLEASFENELGRVRLSGEGSRFRILQMEGLGPPGKEFNVAGYAGQPGQVLFSEKDLARVITVSGDLIAHEGLRDEMARMFRIFYRPGRLTVGAGNKMRSVSCRCTAIEEPERHGRSIAKLVVQFTCDNPYFTDEYAQKVNLFSREDLITSTFTLPCVFTRRTNRLLVVNAGDVRAEPVFTIYNDNRAAAAATADTEAGVAMINHTTGQQLVLERAAAPGEVVTIDIPNRQIVSSLDGDVTSVISQDTYLSDFWLDVGVNDVEAVSYATGERIGVVMTYYNQYVEAIL